MSIDACHLEGLKERVEVESSQVDLLNEPIRPAVDNVMMNTRRYVCQEPESGGMCSWGPCNVASGGGRAPLEAGDSDEHSGCGAV
eukprot:gene10655-12335_t